MSTYSDIIQFIDKEGRLISLPAKRKKKLLALFYIASMLDAQKVYTEKEINDDINKHSLFNDPATVRRELFNNRFIGRENDGSSYWFEKEQPTLKDLGIE